MYLKSILVFATQILLATALTVPFAPQALAKAKTKASLPAPSGIYLVLKADRDAKALTPLGNNEILLPFDCHFLEPQEREPLTYLVLQKEPFVPFVLKDNPVEDRESGTTKPRLQLALADSQVEPLKAFTSANLGKTIAIVIGGEIVTTHKVKSIITGGRLQITRCTKHGCETLYSRLLQTP